MKSFKTLGRLVLAVLMGFWILGGIMHLANPPFGRTALLIGLSFLQIGIAVAVLHWIFKKKPEPEVKQS